jgi:hypothetical protein
MGPGQEKRKGGKQPGDTQGEKGGSSNDPIVEAVSFKKLIQKDAVDEEFVERVQTGKHINVFNPNGTDEEQDPANMYGMPGMGGKEIGEATGGGGGGKGKGKKKEKGGPDLTSIMGTKSMKKPQPAEGSGVDRCLLRFIDMDVQPNRYYKYKVRVRLENPNYKKYQEVAYKSLASVETLFSEEVETAEVFTGPDLAYYLVDESLNPKTKEKGHVKLVGDASTATPTLLTPFQVHRWVEETPDGVKVGDWMVAERLQVHRGEFIGKLLLMEVPQWNQIKERFDFFGSQGKQIKGKPSPKGTATKLPVDFRTTSLLVDFEYGGVGGPVEALVLNGEGQLVVLNGRSDFGYDDPEKSARGVERRLRREDWHSRMGLIRAQDEGKSLTDTGKGGIN